MSIQPQKDIVAANLKCYFKFVRERVPWRPEWILAGGSLLACVAFLTLAELGLRLAEPSYLDERPAVAIDRLHRYSERYGWELKPGAHQLDDGKPVSVNALGYRGQPLPSRPASGHQRVVMLGDSVTFGTYVSDGQTFADVLQARDNGLEIVNLAVQGYGLGQELIRLEREGLSYQPDVVVANVCLANDFADIMLPVFLYDGVRPTPYYRIEDGRLVLHDEHLRLGPVRRLGVALHERSHLFNRLLALGPAAPPPPESAPGAWVERRARALADAQQAVRLGRALLGRMRAVSEQAGARFVVALHPDKATFKSGSEWVEALVAAPDLQGVTLLDLRREYRERGLRFGDLTVDGIGHLSAAGHHAAATILEPHLRPTADARLARLSQL